MNPMVKLFYDRAVTNAVRMATSPTIKDRLYWRALCEKDWTNALWYLATRQMLENSKRRF